MADRPAHEIRLGRIKAAIWRNETEQGPRHSVSIVRIYKTDKGWETSSSFGRDELPLVAKVADMAHTWIYQHGEQEKATPEPPSEPRSQTSRRSRERAVANS